MKKIFQLLLFSIFTIFFVFCGSRGNTEKQKEQIQLLTYLQNNNTPKSTVQASCFNFVTAENTCISAPDNQMTTCSDSELTRIKSGIQTSDKRTESITIAFFNCWKNCALLFNATNSICTGTKYPTTKTYREAQKSTLSTASATWGTCMTKCNNGESEEDGLKGTGATYPTQPF